MALDFKRSLYNNKHPVQNFYMWKLEEKIIISPLWTFVQDQLFTRAACWGGSRIPGQILDPGVLRIPRRLTLTALDQPDIYGAENTGKTPAA